MIAPRWRASEKPTGRVRFRVGRFRRAQVQIEMERTLSRYPGEKKPGGTVWRDATKADATQLIRAGVLAPDHRGDHD